MALDVSGWSFIAGKVHGRFRDIPKNPCLKFYPSIMNIRVSRIFLSFIFSLLGMWKTLEVNGWGFIVKKVSGWLNNVMIYFLIFFYLSRINKRASRTLMSFLALLLGL